MGPVENLPFHNLSSLCNLVTTHHLAPSADAGTVSAALTVPSSAPQGISAESLYIVNRDLPNTSLSKISLSTLSALVRIRSRLRERLLWAHGLWIGVVTPASSWWSSRRLNGWSSCRLNGWSSCRLNGSCVTPSLAVVVGIAVFAKELLYFCIIVCDSVEEDDSVASGHSLAGQTVLGVIRFAAFSHSGDLTGQTACNSLEEIRSCTPLRLGFLIGSGWIIGSQ